MSTTVDHRVVEMRFDNDRFEKNAATTLSTLDKLKRMLNLTGASKGLQELNTAARKVDLSPLTKSTDNVVAKFSHMQMSVQHQLDQIVDSAARAGKRIVSALTIDPVKTGFQEYETQINSVQTILANTQSKGTTIDDVNRALEELNKYADKTIYNFTEMTRNIGTFTAAGIELETATNAIQGIANLAAVSGSTSQQASTAMYQLSQALASGTVKLMDWNSVVNAGMGGQVFQDALKETARVHGVAIDKMIKEQGSFRETLSEGWITADILTETLQKFTMSAEGMTEAQIASNREMLKAKGYTEEQIDGIFELGKTATDAATKVKTFTQLWDVMKESAQSGWSQTWKIIIGDFDEAKSLLTPLADYITGFINNFSDVRNTILGEALGSKWDKINEKLKQAGYTGEQFVEQLTDVLKENGISTDDLIKKYGSLTKAISAGKIPADKITKALKRLLGIEEKATDATKKVTMTVEELEKVAKRVINGDFGSGEIRIKRLTEAGYDYATVQNKVNEMLGSATRHTSKLTEEQLANADSLAKMTDEQLKAKGYTQEQIEALRELEKAAEGADSTITDLIRTIEKPSGKTLLLESFKNIWIYFQDICKSIKDAWVDVFGESDTNKMSDNLYKLIEDFHELTEALDFSGEKAESFQKIMQGVFAGFQLGGSIASKSVVGSLKILNAVLNLFGTDILGVAAKIADYIIVFNEWVKTHTMFGYGTMFDKIAEILVTLYEGVDRCIKAFLGLDKVQGIIQRFTSWLTDLFGSVDGAFNFFSLDGIIDNIIKIFDKIEAYIKAGNEAENLGAYLIEGLVRGIVYATKTAATALVDFAVNLWTSFCEFWGISSPSKLMESAGEFIVQGLINGLGTIDWTKVSAMFWNLSALLPNAGILNLIAAAANTVAVYGSEYADQFIGLGGNIIDGLINGIVSAAKGLGQIVITIATTIYDIFAGFFDVHSPSRLMIALGGFIISGLVIGLLQNIPEVKSVMDNFGSSIGEWFKNVGAICVNVLKELDFGKIFAVGLSVGLIATLKNLTDAISIFAKPAEGLAKMFGSIGKMAASIGDGAEAFMKSKAFKNNGAALVRIALAIGILAASVFLLSKIDVDWKQALAITGVIVGLAGVLVGLGIAMNKFADASVKWEKGKGFNIEGLRQNLIGIGIAILLLAATVKLISGLSPTEAIAGFVGLVGVMSALLIFVKAVAPIAKDDGLKHIHKLGKMMTKFAIAVALMVGVCKLVGMLDPEEALGGIAFAGVFVLFMRSIINVAVWSDGDVNKVGKMLVKMSIAMLLMVGVVKLVSLLKPEEMVKGGLFALGFAAFVAILTSVTKIGNNQKIARLGGLLVSISTAMLMMVGVMKIVSSMTAGEIAKGIGVIVLFGVLMAALIKTSEKLLIWGGGQAAKVGLMLIEVSVAMLIMAGVLLLMKELDSDGIVQAVGIVTWLGVLFGGMIALTHFAQHADKVKGMLVTLTIAIGVLAIAITAMSFLDTKDVIVATSCLTAVMGMFALLIHCAGNIQSETKTWLKGIATIALLTVLVTGFAFTIKMLSELEPDKALGAAGSLSILLLAIAGSLKIISNSKTFSKKNMVNLLIVLTALTIVVAAMGVVISCLRDIDPLSAIGGATGIGILLLALSTSLNVISRSKSINDSKILGIVSTLGALLVAIAVIGTVLYCLRNIDPIKAIGNATAIGILLLALSTSFAVIANSKSISKARILGIVSTLGALVVAIAAIGTVLYCLRNVDPAKAIGNATAIGILLLALSAALDIVALSKSISESKLPGIITTLAMLTLAIMAIAAMLYVMRDVDPRKAIGNAAAIGALLLVLSASLDLISLSKSINTKKLPGILASLAMLTLVAGALSVVIRHMRDVDPVTAIGNAAALAILLGAFTALLFPLASIGASAKNAVKGALALTSMVVPLLAFAFSISVMPDISGARATLTALTTIMTAMTLLMIPLTIIGGLWTNAMKGAIALTVMAVPMLAFVGVLALASNVENAVSNVEALIKLMTVTTLLLIPLTAIGLILTTGVGALMVGGGILALTAMAIPMLAFVGVLALMDKVPNAITNTGLLITLMTSMTDLLTRLAIIGPFALVGEMALVGLLALIVGFGVVATAVGKLMENHPALESFLNKGVGLFVGLAEGLGTIIGKFITGFTNEVMTILPSLGTALGDFMNNMEPFITTGKTIDADLLKGVGYLTSSILLLAAGDFISDILTIGGSSLASTASQLTKFAINLLPFIATIKLIDPSVVDSAANIGKLLLILAGATWCDALVRLVDCLPFYDSIESMGERLGKFAKVMADFSKAIAENGGIDTDAIQKAADAGSAMVALANSIPRSEGFLQDIIGEADLEKFGTMCKAFGEAIKTMSESLTGEGGAILVNQAAVDAAVVAGESMNRLAKAIPRTEGFVQDWIGESDLAKFGLTCLAFGDAIRDMSAALTGKDGSVLINKAAVDSAVSAGTAMTKVADAIPRADGFLQDIVGVKDLEAFGERVKAFGASVAAMSASLTGQNGEVLVNDAAITAAEKAGTMMAAVQEAIPTDKWLDGKVPIDEFGGKIESFGKSIFNFSDAVAGADLAVVSTAVMQADRLVSLTKRVVDLDTSGIAEFKKVADIATTMSTYATNVSTIDTVALTTSVTTATKLRDFIASLIGLDGSGVSNFKLGAIGAEMKSYIEAVRDADPAIMSTSVFNAGRLSAFIAELTGLDSSGVENFKIGEIGSALKSYGENVSAIDTAVVSGSITLAYKIRNFINDLIGIDTTGVADYKSAISELGTISFENFINAFNVKLPDISAMGTSLINTLVSGVKSSLSAITNVGQITTENLLRGINSKKQSIISSIDDLMNTLISAIRKRAIVFNDAGVLITTRLIAGVDEHKGRLKLAFADAVMSALSKISAYHDDFVSVGGWLVEGLASGISANSYVAEAKASAMASAAYEAAKRALDINSPSKIFRSLGYAIPEGFAMGIDKLSGLAANSAVYMADNTINTVSDSISRIAEVISSDIDSQPTIRPVLDLTNVRAGANSINGMLGIGGSMSVMSNVHAISSMMNSGQNGGNNDVVSAIDKLRGAIGNMNNTTYQVNGVTYDDGSNIANAVSQLVRHAKIGRRV